MKMKFDIQYRPQIESGKYSVETADGHPIRIICWDATSDWPVCAMIRDYNLAMTYGYPQLFDEDGRSINDRAKDLVIVIPDPELTEFETAYLRLVHRLSPGDILPEFVDENHLRENCRELMDIARKQFEPELLSAVMKGRKEALNMTAEDILNFKMSNPVTWASIVGPEIKAARIEGKEDALKIYRDNIPFAGEYQTDYRQGVMDGAKWQKNHLWKPADGDDLPEYEREVIVFTQNYPDNAGMMMVAIGHRPTPEGFDGKSLTTGEVEHYTPKTYDKGGWNIPNIVYWLDVELPKEIEQ